MYISEVKKRLAELKKEHGDIEVCWKSLSHTFPLDNIHAEGEGEYKRIIVND